MTRGRGGELGRECVSRGQQGRDDRPGVLYREREGEGWQGPRLGWRQLTHEAQPQSVMHTVFVPSSFCFSRLHSLSFSFPLSSAYASLCRVHHVPAHTMVTVCQRHTCTATARAKLQKLYIYIHGISDSTTPN